MTVQHSAIEDPNIHEPKGIAGQDAGKVYLSNGSDSGTWEYPPAKAHAELLITGGATTHTLAAVSAYTKLNPGTEWTASGNEEHLTVDAVNGEIDLEYANHYYVSFHMTFDTTAIASGTTYSFDLARDGTPIGRPITVSKITNGVDTLFVSFTQLINATANQVLSIHVAGDATSSGQTITPKEAGLTALYLD